LSQQRNNSTWCPLCSQSRVIKGEQSAKGKKVEKEAVRKGSKKSRVEKETVSKRSSPVKQPSQKTQADSGHKRKEMD
jgi:hypothetical protein